MNWLAAALASAVLLAGQGVGLRTLSKRHTVSSYMSITWIMSGLLLVFVGFLPGAPAINSGIWLVLPAGLCSWGAMYAYNLALRTSDNPGNADAVSSLRTPIVYVVDLVLLTSQFEFVRMIGVVLSVACVALLARYGGPADSSPASGRTWVVWSGLSAIGFAGLIIFSVEAVRRGNGVAVCAGATLIIAGALFVLQASLGPGMGSILAPLRVSGAVLVITIVLAAIGNLSLIYASAMAPNAGYATAVASTRAGMLYLAWIITRRVRINAPAAAAVVGMIVSVALTAI